MKKVIMLLAVVLGFAVSASAQDSKMGVGVNLNMGFGNSYTNYGLGAKYQYNFTEHWTGEGSFNYFFKKDYVSFWDLNVNAHYNFNLGQNGLQLYPLAGLGMQGVSPEVGDGDSELGFNFGAGANYPLTDNLKFNLEYKYNTAWDGRNFLSVGVVYCF